jgi:hypothetical protein
VSGIPITTLIRLRLSPHHHNNLLFDLVCALQELSTSYISMFPKDSSTSFWFRCNRIKRLQLYLQSFINILSNTRSFQSVCLKCFAISPIARFFSYFGRLLNFLGIEKSSPQTCAANARFESFQESRGYLKLVFPFSLVTYMLDSMGCVTLWEMYLSGSRCSEHRYETRAVVGSSTIATGVRLAVVIAMSIEGRGPSSRARRACRIVRRSCRRSCRIARRASRAGCVLEIMTAFDMS